MTTSPATVIDPVCGMSVDPASARASADHEGKMYYFCAKGCKKAFLEEPDQYIRPNRA